MRRPPQLWEQKLSRITSILGVGISSSGDATSIVNPSPPPGSDGPGTDPGPTLPPPGAFIKPSTPILTGAVQGIRVRWDGLNSAGDLWPYDTSWIEVHMATSGTGFTPDATTLKGRLDYPGEFYVGGLSAGTTYHFRLRGADPAGNYTEPSDAASGQTGLTTSGDYGTATITQGAVSFNARQIGGVTSTVGTVQPTSPVVGDIWLDTTGGATTHKRWNGTTWETILFGSGSIADLAITTVKIDQSAITAAKLSNNAVTAAKIAAGAIEADKIAANAITADKIAANAITSDKIAANTITASDIAANTITGSLIAANTITATNIATGAITAGAIAAGEVTAGKLAADAIDAMTITGATIRTNSGSGARVVLDTSGLRGFDALNNERVNINASTGDLTMTGGTITSGYITGGTVTGARFVTSANGSRVRLSDNVTGPWGTSDAIEFFDGGNQAAMMHYVQGLGLDIYSNKISLLNKAGSTGPGSVDAQIFGDLTIWDDLRVDNATSLGDSGANVAFRVDASGNVYSYGVDDNTTASAANVRVGASAQLFRSTSTVRLKDELAPLEDDLAGVPAEKIADFPASVDPYDVLTLTPTEFRSLSPADADARSLGFIAEDVAAKLPWAANWDDEGLPSAVEDRPILAALLWVVREQQATITDLRTRIEALEA